MLRQGAVVSMVDGDGDRLGEAAAGLPGAPVGLLALPQYSSGTSFDVKVALPWPELGPQISPQLRAVFGQG
jgi:hypothetical protein